MWFSYETKQIKNVILSIGHSCCIDDYLLMRNCPVSVLSVFWIRKFAFNTIQCLFGLFYYEFYINS